MSVLVPDLVRSEQLPHDLAVLCRDPDGAVRTMGQAMADRWFAVDVLVIPATRPVHPAERGMAALSRAMGPIALALGFLVPIIGLLR